MSNPYATLREKHQREMNAFPLGFAFNKKQFVEMMKKWGLSPDDTDKICHVGMGSYVRKSDADAFHKMIDRHEKEREEAIRENKDDYLYHMFNYELANHEYSYTGELDDTLDALGLTMEEINADARMVDALRRAMQYQMEINY
jgi:hypothetical protein